MNKPLQPVRGTHDLYGEALALHRQVETVARRVAALYGAGELAPPVFEFSEVFHRTLGETSDVVSKETYTFDDRGGESLTLRPEFTAQIVRAFLSNGLTQQLPFKAFYAGPAFRYERPQKGRLRQFHQIGMEILGADTPLYDVETIAASAATLRALGLLTHATLELNTLGDRESRERYRALLVTYFSDHRTALSAESQARLSKNPLRILDSKQEEDRALVADAPALAESFTAEAAVWFDAVKEGLAALEISYTVSPRLVRGLDYYTHTVFEWTSPRLGAQNTLLAGGRYDGLVEQMGGPLIPGIGWAAGIERLCLALEESGAGAGQAEMAPVALIPLSEAERVEALVVAEWLRQKGIACAVVLRANPGKALKKADALGAKLALLIGEEEVNTGSVTVKHLASGTQTRVLRKDLADMIHAQPM